MEISVIQYKKKKEPNRRYIYLYEIIHPVLNLVLMCAFTGV